MNSMNEIVQSLKVFLVLTMTVTCQLKIFHH